MASLIPGYEYDIFISYRQKDNKYDGWVTEFVGNLKKELEATFKEEISVYFDINPHDGLLETHDVNASLKDKLKCLVFIPIISRTYCDPKSFAWEHEFKAFVEQTSQDQFGLKVRLPNGNVASRVLPIQIHEIVADDKTHIERELGGILRPVEFIYKEPGVNRPLRGNEDHPDNNLNKTFYRNQINKTANAIDEIIYSLKNVKTAPVKEKPQSTEPLAEVCIKERMNMQVKPAKFNRIKILSGVLITAILVIAAIIAYPKIFKRDSLEKLRSSGERISVVVMPFQNMTNDTTKNVLQDWIQDILITALSNSKEIKVMPTESINNMLKSKGITNYASITPSIANSVSQKLDANFVINGNIKQSGSLLRLNVQLIDSKTEEVIKSFQIDGTYKEGMIFGFIDSLSSQVNDFLVISKLKKENLKIQELVFTKSPDAYRYFIYGQSAFAKRDFPSAINMLSQAIAIDSNYTYAALHIAWAYMNQGLYEEGKKWCLRVYAQRDKVSIQQKIYTNFVYARFFETPNEAIKYLKQLLEIDDQLPHAYFDLGSCYSNLYQYDNAITAYEKSLQIYKEWDSKPWWVLNYTNLGKAYNETGQYKKEKKLYEKAEQDFADDPSIISRQAILSLTQGDMIAANRYIEKNKSINKENSVSEADIATGLAGIFSEAGNLDEAEKYLRQAFSLEPEKPVRLNNLAYFLIDKDRNVNEGLEFVNKALKLKPDNYSYLDCKGWGLYKQGKYKEALEILQKSWDLRKQNAVYYHTAYLHLEAAKKAVAGQN
jgi:tetratricopeptide (TPR) repeat protein